MRKVETHSANHRKEQDRVMGFCTVVNCIDGRVQLPVIRHLQIRFNVEHVDSVTEPGANLVLASHADQASVQSILKRVGISVKKHASVGIVLVGHHDCAANPATEKEQQQHLIAGVEFLCLHYRGMPIIGLWVDENWEVKEVVSSEQAAAADAAKRRG